MADLERALRELNVDWPPTPDVAAAVRATIVDEEGVSRGQTPIATRRLNLRRRGQTPSATEWPNLRRRALVAAVVAALAATAAIEPARSAVLEFLGLKGATIERREPDPPPAPPARAPLGADLGLGEPVSLGAAARRAGFEPVAPASLGPPGAVFVDDQLGVSLVYPPGPGLPESAQTGAGLLITQVLGRVSPYIAKAAGAGTRVERLAIDGDSAYFLSGAAHGFAYESYAGDTRYEDQRLAGNTLLVEHGDLLLRIEGEVGRARATAIAREVTATFDP